MLVIVARALSVRPAGRLDPSSKVYWVVGTKPIELKPTANDNRLGPLIAPDRKEG